MAPSNMILLLFLAVHLSGVLGGVTVSEHVEVESQPALLTTEELTLQNMLLEPAAITCDPVDPNTPETIYHAPPRFVPPPAVDSLLKREFFLLFHREGNPTHSHVTPTDNLTIPGVPVTPIDPAIIQQINTLCPRDAFFYSFSPRHQEAIGLLRDIFLQQATAANLLILARQELHRHEINPRVWYYALLNTLLLRSDLNGYYLPSAIDVTPDLYVPWSIIHQALSQSPTRPPPDPEQEVCTSATGISVAQFSFSEQSRSVSAVAHPAFAVDNGLLYLSHVPVPHAQAVASAFQLPVAVHTTQPHNILLQEIVTNPEPQCILFNGTGGAPGAENLLWYFREDVLVNEHHWWWHNYFPLERPNQTGHADRRGEMFYFAHHNLVARYNAERISNSLPVVEDIDLRLNANIGAGYTSDMNDRRSGRFWTPRLDNVPLSDIAHENDPDFQLPITMAEIRETYDMFLSHITNGFLIANRSLEQGQPPVEYIQDIRTPEGVSHIGNTFEASPDLSLHPNRYHPYGVHNLAHIVIALATDPDFGCQLPTGVMADLTVTMRDPAFYRVHSLVDTTFDRSKAILPPYQLSNGEWPLIFPGVNLQSVELIQPGRSPNSLQTFWSIRRFPLEEGIDGTIHDGDVDALVCQQHLNHEPFLFRFVVDVDSCFQSQSSMGTLRLFMAPRFNIDGRRFTMDETRKLLIQLDAFPVELKPGRNVITRNSVDSSSTRPWSRSLRDLLQDPDNGGRAESCSCGWPQHLFVPKGRPEGMQFDLFAMITSFDEDNVDHTVEELNIPETCNSPYLFCGIPYRRYPDRRPMNYPFDRQAYAVAEEGGNVRPLLDLEEFTANVNNMQSSVVTITHLDQIVSTSG